MKAWEVVGIEFDGELICEACLKNVKERKCFEGFEIEDMSPCFAVDTTDQECSRCHRKLVE